VKLSSFGRTMVDELRGMLVARGGGNSRMLATAGTISTRRIRIQRMTAVCGGMSAVVLWGIVRGSRRSQIGGVGTASNLNCVEDLDGVDIRSFAPAIGIVLDQRTAFCPFGVAAGRDALGPEVARRVRGEMDHETVRISMACAAALVHLAAGIGGLELNAHDDSVMK